MHEMSRPPPPPVFAFLRFETLDYPGSREDPEGGRERRREVARTKRHFRRPRAA